MYRNIKFLAVLSALLFLSDSLLIGASNPATSINNIIKAIVTGINNRPVGGAVVMDSKGNVLATTSNDGSFSIKLEGQSELKIVAEGFSVQTIKPQEFLKSTIELVPVTTDLKRVPLAFGSISQDQMVGAVTVLDADELQRLDNGQSVTEAIRGRVPGMYNTSNLRNYGSLTWVIDGLERDPSYLTLNEVDKIVVLKDCSSRMLMGAKGTNGVVLITTKRGQPGKLVITAEAGYSIATPVSYPQFMNSYDYARYYNEARANDGLTPLYSDQQLAGYQSGSRIKYPDHDYYNSTFLRDYTSQGRLSTQFRGGNENTRYYLHLMGTNNNSLLNVGQGKKQGNNNFSIRANIDTKITSFIKLRVDLASYFGFANNPNGNFFGNASTFRPNDYPMFIPVDSVPAASASLLTSAFKTNGSILGGNQTYQTNVYGDLMYGGYNKVVNRINQMNSSLDIDLGSVLKGLSFAGGISFDLTAVQTIQQLNTYSVYEPYYIDNALTSIKKYKIDQISGSQKVTSTDFKRRFGFFGNFEYANTFGDHSLYANLMGYGESFNDDAVLQPENMAHYGMRANYGFKRKYLVEFDGAYVGSRFLAPDNRFQFAPSIGVAWVLTNENFMKGLTKIEFLKLRASWGIINAEDGFTTYHSYETAYQNAGGSYAYGGLTGDYTSNALRYKSIANSNLGFGNREDINLGFEGSFFGNRLQLTGNWFYRNQYNDPTKLTNTYPEYLGGVFPLENAGKRTSNGVEASVLFKQIKGDFRYSVGGNIVYQQGKVIKLDEPFYEYDYLKRTGKATDAIFSYVSEGFFKDAADIASHATQTFGDVFPGDIKYKDLNNDGVIDQNDQQVIGNSNSRIYYGMNLTLGYKNLELFALGSGQAGGEYIQNDDYYWVRGNQKYPSYLAESRWTPVTAETATYPRLTTKESSNNFMASSFWLRKNNWMRLHTVQLNYKLPSTIIREGGKLKNIKLYLRGSNLLTVSDIRNEIDLNVGSAPQMRTYVVGLNANF
ncbi:MAG: SusC/RagA family TonB-linked outer membrane protein [Prolixibacteraceae bacterium]|nr:SusC/RagA family TonB-linked outer membrane protein [Prolixibacteraceae bacterium]